MSSSKKSSDQQEVNLLNLPADQLNQLYSVWKMELQQYTTYLQSMHKIKERFRTSQQCLKQLRDAKKGTETLIPLTGSLYVAGDMGDVNDAMVDVGTGYYIKKDIPGAVEVIDRRLKHLEENMEKIQKAVTEKQQVVNTCERAMMARKRVAPPSSSSVASTTSS